MKSLTSLWSCTADELAVRCCTSATRDKTTVVSRVKHEGISFLAITLANYGKAIEGWLDRGFVTPSDCPAFTLNRLTGLPAFLSGFHGRVFDPSSGVLLDDPDIEAIYALRQLTLMFSKIALPEVPSQGSRRGVNRKVVSPKRERRAMSEYVQCEHDVRASDERIDSEYISEFKRMSEMLFGMVFAKVDRDVHWGRVIPKHGPGAVGEKIGYNAKYNHRTWTVRLEKVFPSSSFLYTNQRTAGLSSGPNVVEPGAEMPVRVITVPKTLKTPRIIAIEPVAMQYVQQGLSRAFLSAISEDGFLARTVGFDDQDPNREMARRGSHSGDLATLDLSEASDRVSNQLVTAMLEDYPELLRAVSSARSAKADIPGVGVIPLAKYASMGSGLCFPIESMVFLTIAFLGIARDLSAPLSRRTLIKRFSEQVRVFGDDIIVPKDYVLSVIAELEYFGFRVNDGKSFWTGRFRESCGREYYDGQDVSIVKVRSILPTSRLDANRVESAVAFRNLAYWAGLWKTAAWMDSYLGKLLKFFPNVAPSSRLLGRESALGYQFETLHPNTQSPLTKGYYLRSKLPLDSLEGDGALLKCLLQKEPPIGGVVGRVMYPPTRPFAVDVASVDDEHLTRSGRAEYVSIKLGRMSPF